MDKEIKNCAGCLFKTSMCNGLSEADFANIFEQTRIQNYHKGEVILKQGTKSNSLIYLTSGIVKFVYENNARELIVAIDKAQTLIGLANILNEDINLFSVVAVEPCQGCIINLSRFKLLMMNNRSVMFNVMSTATQMFRSAIYNFISVARKQSNGRVADVLIYLSDKIYKSRSFNLALSRQELADFAGCSKEQLIHTIRNFSNDGIIWASGKKIEILDYNKLSTISRVG